MSCAKIILLFDIAKQNHKKKPSIAFFYQKMGTSSKKVE
jgi:hypothetical protein